MAKHQEMLPVSRMAASPDENRHEVVCVLELVSHAAVECQSCKNKSRSAYGIAFYTRCPGSEVSIEKKDT